MRFARAAAQGGVMSENSTRHADDAHADDAPPTDAVSDEVREDAAEAGAHADAEDDD